MRKEKTMIRNGALRSLIVALSLFFAASCSDVVEQSKARKTEALDKAKGMFDEAVEDFENETNKARKKFEKGKEVLHDLEETINKAKKKNSEFAKVQKKWKSVSDQMRYIKDVVRKVARSAAHLYGKLEKRGNQNLKKES